MKHLPTLILLFILTSPMTAGAQRTPDFPPDGVTARMDYQNMLEQLGITLPELPSVDDDPRRPAHIHPARPGERNAWLWWSAPDYKPGDTLRYQVTRSPFGLWMNYHETPELEGAYRPIDPLADVPGGPVDTPEAWRDRARPVWMSLCRETIWGRTPAVADSLQVEWTCAEVKWGGEDIPYRKYTLDGWVDTSMYPALKHRPCISGLLYLPKDARDVPLIIQFAWFNEPMPEVYLRECMARGWGLLQMDCRRLQPNDGASLTDYLIGLCNRGQWRRPDDWGTLAAWAWGASRLVDYFEQDPRVDARRIGITGHSRYGKAALAAMATDERLAVAYLSCSGTGGTSPMRRHYGEDFESLGWDRLHHWLAGNALRWCGELVPGRYLPRRVATLPVDAQVMLSLCAPRPVFIGAGESDTWSDPQGSYLTCQRTSPVYELLGVPGFVSADPHPRTDRAYTQGHLAYRMHQGDHTDVPDWSAFMEWAERFLE